MEDYIKKLSSVDSPIATAIIWKRLMRKNTPPHKLEAWLFFMMENYWTLYTKNIYKYKWKFLWYEALWGTIWDKLFHEVKDKAAGLNIQFSEEVLVHSLLKKQCYWHWFKWIHRRSRIHKEYEWKWKAWLQKDNEKWKKDADSKRTIEWRIEWAMWELTTWTYPNAMWWFELIIWKWWPMDKMNKIPFIMLFSWLWYSINEKMADKFKNLMKAWLNIPAVRFISNISDIELFNRTVVELSKRLTEVYWSKDKRYLYMHDRAKKILVNQKKWKNEVEQINAAANFFDDYWEILTRSMYMLNTWKNDELNYADKLIFLEKDENPTFNEYFNTFRVFIDREVNYGEASYMTDWFKQAWLSWYYLQKFTVDVLKYRNWGNFASNVWNDALFEVEREFLAIPNRNYWWGKKNDKEVKSMLIRDNLRQFIAWILINHSSDAKVLESINMPWSHFSRIFDRYWVNLTEFNKNNINAWELISWKNVIAEKILDRYVSNAFDWKDHSKDRWVLWVVQNVWWTILDTLNNKPWSND